MAERKKPKNPATDADEGAIPFKKEGNAYDKIYKQIEESNFLPMAEEKMGVKFIAWLLLKEKMQNTLETEIDFCYRITKDDGTDAILHLEFQSTDDHKMILRMIEYHGMLVKRYALPVYHFVIYFGQKKTDDADAGFTRRVVYGF